MVNIETVSWLHLRSRLEVWRNSEINGHHAGLFGALMRAGPSISLAMIADGLQCIRTSWWLKVPAICLVPAHMPLICSFFFYKIGPQNGYKILTSESKGHYGNCFVFVELSVVWISFELTATFYPLHWDIIYVF